MFSGRNIGALALGRRYYSHEALRRSYLYVPCSSQRMLKKSLSVNSDIIIYDLEDSVAPKDKAMARQNLANFLSSGQAPDPARVVVRINDMTTHLFEQDLASIGKSANHITGLVLPKVHSVSYLDHVSVTASRHANSPLQIIPSIESALGLMNISSIASWKPQGICTLSALLFAAEDYCADTSIIRSKSRNELLFTRSKIVNAAKAHRLEAIDMVCVNYKDQSYLAEECRDGRALGFSGKQAIHPSQIDVIQSTFVPTAAEILRAAKIVHGMEKAHQSQKGAIGLDGEMIDAPMIKQAQSTIRIAVAAGLEIPLL